jgi:hypothetical protein
VPSKTEQAGSAPSRPEQAGSAPPEAQHIGSMPPREEWARPMPGVPEMKDQVGLLAGPEDVPLALLEEHVGPALRWGERARPVPVAEDEVRPGSEPGPGPGPEERAGSVPSQDSAPSQEEEPGRPAQDGIEIIRPL